MRVGIIVFGVGVTFFSLLMFGIVADSKSGEVGKNLKGVVLLTVIVAGHFLPSGIALARKHANFMPVFMVNVFLGWLCIGWIVALVWAFSDQKDGRGRDWW